MQLLQLLQCFPVLSYLQAKEGLLNTACYGKYKCNFVQGHTVHVVQDLEIT